MDFDPPEAVRPLLDRIEKFVADVVMPAEATVLEHGFAASTAMLSDLRAQCKAAKMSCRAVRSGDDYVIDGHKWFTTAAGGARIYDGPDEVHKMSVSKRILARYS